MIIKEKCPLWVKEVLRDEIRYTESMQKMESIEKYLKHVENHPEEHLGKHKERSTRDFMKIVTRKKTSLPPIPRKSKKWTG